MATYLEKIQAYLQKIQEEETDIIETAAKAVADAVEKGGIVYLFGSGHSHMLVEEALYRASGFAAVRPVLHEPLMLHRGALTSSRLEKTPDYADTFMDELEIGPEDVMIVISTSGRNPVPIDVALGAKKAGATVIGLTSKASAQSASRHPSGKLLLDCADHVIDNHVPYGDGAMTSDKTDVSYGPVSTVLGSAIINQLFVFAIDMLLEKGIEPPVFKSGNVDGSDAHNKRLIEKYKRRNPFLQ